MKMSRFAATRRVLSPLALVALAGIGATAWQAPAAAKEQKAEPAQKANYSKEFVAAYKPLEEQSKAATPDYAAMKAAIPGLVTAASTPDDKLVAGRLIFMVGQKTNDFATSLQGAEMALNSGKADQTLQAQFSFVAGQLAYNLKDYAKAQAYAQKAIELGYKDNDPEAFVAETYFAQGKNAEGLKYLSDMIAARKAAGQPVKEEWLKRGLAVAYSNKLNDQARQWGVLYASNFPSQTSWGDAIAVVMNTSDFDQANMLDLLRLARTTGAMRTKAMYLEYIDAADARKLPSEVSAVIDQGIAAKMIDPSIQLVKDSRTVAAGRIAADKTELPALQRDANSGNAKLVTVMAAADTLLSYGKDAEAETLYAKALGMAGVNTPLVQTRLGIAQVHEGKFKDAQATFAKVQGPSKPIADLWGAYAAQKAGGAAPTTPSAT